MKLADEKTTIQACLGKTGRHFVKSSSSIVKSLSDAFICGTVNYSNKVAFAMLSGFIAFGASTAAYSQTYQRPSETVQLDENGYKVRSQRESEFDNQSDQYILDWRQSNDDYEDTDFGELVYNEPSPPTKLEVLRLLSKETPSTTVLMHAMSMGVDIETALQATVNYSPERARDLAGSAINLLPIFSDNEVYSYSAYRLDDLARDDQTQLYSVQDVADKFFKQRLVLKPYPDWFEGQYHFLASAAELKKLQEPNKNIRWYRSKSFEDIRKRPVFVSLYENSKTILIDSEEQINAALQSNPDAKVPVVFIFNRLNERPIDLLGYPPTIRGLQQAYIEESILLTPTPEWQLGEYHIYGGIDELRDIFDIPQEEDFEPEAWDSLIAEAEDYSVTNTAFILVVLGDFGSKKNKPEEDKLSYGYVSDQQYAVWDDPRTEAKFKYTSPENKKSPKFKDIVGKGMVINRPDLIAALEALGVTQVPITFYYLDSTRVKPYFKGPRALIQAAIGLDSPNFVPPSGGGFLPNTPPVVPPVLPPASPPGIQ